MVRVGRGLSIRKRIESQRWLICRNVTVSSSRNGLEGMLAGQMVAMHGAGCERLRRAMQANAAPERAEAA
jgi:hypothetical protein